jgi:23S rRNA pseudouridine1911/1915/1917 synthase
MKANFVVETPGGRLDAYLADQMADQSRSKVQSMIRNGQVYVNDSVVVKPSFEVRLKDSIRVSFLDDEPPSMKLDSIALNVIYETKDFMVVNKPAGVVVHPSLGHEYGTLAQAAMVHAPELQGLGEAGREGLVHRLDKDTSGLIIFAKNLAMLERLQLQFKNREIEKTYLALVDDRPPSDKGRVDASIARDPKNRQRFAVLDGGRAAITEFKVREHFERHTLLEAFPITGRTHQIRIHMKFLGCPVVGDRVYGKKKDSLSVERQMLHAWRLKLPNRDAFEAPTPEDFAQALNMAKAG